MTDYVDIYDSNIEPRAPVTSELMTALRDNPSAIAEGSSGAPKVNSGALAVKYTTFTGGTYASDFQLGNTIILNNPTPCLIMWGYSTLNYNTSLDSGDSTIAVQGSNDYSTWTDVAVLLEDDTGVNVLHTGPQVSATPYTYYRVWASGDSGHYFTVNNLVVYLLGAD